MEKLVRGLNFFTHLISKILSMECFFLFLTAEVSASFKLGTSLSYMFQEVTANSSSSSSVLRSSVHPDISLRAENISLSFRTSHSPALLLYVSSYRREYLAVLLNEHGERKTTLKRKTTGIIFSTKLDISDHLPRVQVPTPELRKLSCWWTVPS